MMWCLWGKSQRAVSVMGVMGTARHHPSTAIYHRPGRGTMIRRYSTLHWKANRCSAMSFDWDFLGKWDIIFGILGGIILILSGVRWLAKKLGLGRGSGIIAWALTGEDDEMNLSSGLEEIGKWVVAAIVWAAISAIFFAIAIFILSVIGIALGATVFDFWGSIVGWAVVGAFAGIIVRIVLWPIGYAISVRLGISQPRAKIRCMPYQQPIEREDRWVSIAVINSDETEVTDCYGILETLKYINDDGKETDILAAERLGWSSSTTSNNDLRNIPHQEKALLDIARTVRANDKIAFTFQRGYHFSFVSEHQRGPDAQS